MPDIEGEGSTDAVTKSVESNIDVASGDDNVGGVFARQQTSDDSEGYSAKEEYAEESPSDNLSSTKSTGNYPADCYTFLAVHTPFDKTLYWYFGFFVWFFQMAFLILFVLRVAHPSLSTNENDDNPDKGFWANFVPANANPLAKATQYMALLSYCIFADDSLKDMITAVETFPNFKRVQPGDNVNWLILSCVLRFSQGLLATIVVFLLVVDTSDVIEIILNFTAINFISAFDDVAFELALGGKYGPALQAEAKRIEDLPAPPCVHRKYQHIRYRYIVSSMIIFLMMSLTLIVYNQDSTQRWLTTTLRVQFKDDPLREGWNGCYHETGVRTNKRVVFQSDPANKDSARFGYCQAERKWYLYQGNKTTSCNLTKEEIVAFSTRTYAFDISTVFEDTWYSPTGTPLELYFFDDEKNDLSDDLCSVFLNDGICNEKFNIFDHNYDEGDCCAATCDNLRCEMQTNMPSAFNTSVTSASGYPNCRDPAMEPITIQLNDVYLPSRTGRSFTDALGVLPREPLLALDCDGKGVLMVNIREDMKNQTETVWVADGAECTLSIKNTTSELLNIWYVSYTVYHGDKETIDTDPIIIFQEDSLYNAEHTFRRIPECFFTKLDGIMDLTTIYTGSEPSNKAVAWLMEDSQGYSNCGYDSFVERYALAAINFAAPVVDNDRNPEGNATSDLWIDSRRQCEWPSVSCTDGWVTEFDLEPRLYVSGTIATEIGLLKKLKWFSLAYNDIGGRLPSQMFELSQLQYIDFDENRVTGTIPTQIGTLSDLEWIFLLDNQLNGTIPSEIGSLASLKGLSLGKNNLSGPIPNELRGTPLLKLIELSANTLTGTIPSVIGNFSDLGFFLAGNNSLSGTIPSELGALSNILDMELVYNSLTGSIPVEIQNSSYYPTQPSWYGNSLSNLSSNNGEVICSAGGGEVVCDCTSHCTFRPEQCGCEEAQSCCSSYLEPYTECNLCPSGFVNPDKRVADLYLGTCATLADLIKKDVANFGNEFSCAAFKYPFNGAGCFCNDAEMDTSDSSSDIDRSSLFVLSDQCAEDLAECAVHEISTCFNNRYGLCLEDGALDPMCSAADPCAPCFPYSRCGIDLAQDSEGNMTDVVVGNFSSQFVESRDCPKELLICIQAARCYDHNNEFCSADGSLVSDCASLDRVCDACFPNSRCGIRYEG